MSDYSADDKYFDGADDAARDESARDPDALRDQDLDQASGGLRALKTGGDAGSASDWQGKNDKPDDSYFIR